MSTVPFSTVFGISLRLTLVALAVFVALVGVSVTLVVRVDSFIFVEFLGN